jgi:hypothetical protein
MRTIITLRRRKTTKTTIRTRQRLIHLQPNCASQRTAEEAEARPRTAAMLVKRGSSSRRKLFTKLNSIYQNLFSVTPTIIIHMALESHLRLHPTTITTNKNQKLLFSDQEFHQKKIWLLATLISTFRHKWTATQLV